MKDQEFIYLRSRSCRCSDCGLNKQKKLKNILITLDKKCESISKLTEEKTLKTEEQPFERRIIKKQTSMPIRRDSYGLHRYSPKRERITTVLVPPSSTFHIREYSQSSTKSLNKNDLNNSQFHNDHHFDTSKIDSHDQNQTNSIFENEINQVDETKYDSMDKTNDEYKGSSLKLPSNNSISPKQRKKRKEMTYEEYMDTYHPKIEMKPEIKQSIKSQSNIVKVYTKNQIIKIADNNKIASQK